MRFFDRVRMHSGARERTEELAANLEAFECKLDRNIEQTVQLATSKTRQLSSVVRAVLGQKAPEATGRESSHDRLGVLVLAG